MTIEHIGDYEQFNYTGNVQEYTIPKGGIYKLEVWGARGGKASNSTYDASGGYSCGYKKLRSHQKLYIVCGGTGGTGGQWAGGTGGYNGGANGTGYDDWPIYASCGGGGGATHIAFVTGTLESIGKTTFDEQGLIVAGGAGGNVWFHDDNGEGDPHNGKGSGGTGGGTSGGTSIVRQQSTYGGTITTASGGTQSTGHSFGKGQSKGKSAGGGGGYYGGYTNYGPGGGGSGWIDGVPSFTMGGVTYEPSTSNGVNNGDGYAKVTLVKLCGIYTGETQRTIITGETERTIAIGDKEL